MSHIPRQALARRTLLAVGGIALLDASVGAVGAVPLPRHSTAAPVRPAAATATTPAAPTPTPHGTATTAAPDYAHLPPGDGCPADDGPATTPTGAIREVPCAGHHRIALTIDDGPDPRYTPQVLALLHRLGITATFCMIGQSAAGHPGLVADVAAAGHHVANHTWDHRDVSRMPQPRAHDEIQRATDAITAAGAPAPTLFRAPGGAWSHALVGLCHTLGLRPLDWSVDPRDWSRPGTSHIVDVITRTTRPGAIILEHDGGGDRSQTVAALTIVLPRLLDQGYEFVTP